MNLEREIQKSGLTYITFKDESNVFLIVNNRFAPDDFRKLIIDWCNRFEQGTVFGTRPYHGTRNPKTIRGYLYTGSGIVSDKFNTAYVNDVINNCSAMGPQIHETHWPINYRIHSYKYARGVFKHLYPHLVIDPDSFIKSGINGLDGNFGAFRRRSLYAVGGSKKTLSKALFLDLVLKTAKYSISHGTGVKVYYYCLKARGKSIREKLVKMSGLNIKCTCFRRCINL